MDATAHGCNSAHTVLVQLLPNVLPRVACVVQAVCKAYLKQRLTSVLFSSEASTLKCDQPKRDDVWDVLDANAKLGRKGKRGAQTNGAQSGSDDEAKEAWTVDGKWGRVAAEAKPRGVKRKRVVAPLKRPAPAKTPARAMVHPAIRAVRSGLLPTAAATAAGAGAAAGAGGGSAAAQSSAAGAGKSKAQEVAAKDSDDPRESKRQRRRRKKKGYRKQVFIMA